MGTTNHAAAFIGYGAPPSPGPMRYAAAPVPRAPATPACRQHPCDRPSLPGEPGCRVFAQAQPLGKPSVVLAGLLTCSCRFSKVSASGPQCPADSEPRVRPRRRSGIRLPPLQVLTLLARQGHPHTLTTMLTLTRRSTTAKSCPPPKCLLAMERRRPAHRQRMGDTGPRRLPHDTGPAQDPSHPFGQPLRGDAPCAPR